MVKEVLEFLKETKRFYIATIEDGAPKIRPFGAAMEYEGKLYCVTSNTKKVYEQIIKNPNISIVACDDNRKWVRVEGTAKFDNRTEAKQKMLDDNPILLQRKRYTDATDPTMAIFHLDNMSIEFN